MAESSVTQPPCLRATALRGRWEHWKFADDESFKLTTIEEWRTTQMNEIYHHLNVDSLRSLPMETKMLRSQGKRLNEYEENRSYLE